MSESPIKRLGRLFSTPARLTAFSGYLSVVASMVFGLVSLRMAGKYLSNEEFGVWNVFGGVLGILLMVDFGVSSAASRMMATPLSRNDRNEIDSWWTVIVFVLLTQGVLLLMLGLGLENFIIAKYQISPELVPTVHRLWKVLIIANAVKIPFQCYAAILFCQNRFYHMHFSTLVNNVANFVVFVILLLKGYRLDAYVWAVVASILVMLCYWLWAVRISGIQLNVRRGLFRTEKVGKLFGYSGSLFIAAIAVQFAGSAPSLVIGKVLGMSAAGAFGYSTKAFFILSQLLLRTQEAQVPKWWLRHAEGDTSGVVAERGKQMRWFLPLTLFCAIGLLVFNRAFVAWFKPGIEVNRWLDVVLALTLVVQQFLKSVEFVYPLVQRTWRWALVTLGDCLLQIAAGYFIGVYWGPAGILAAALVATLVTSLPFTLFAGPGLLGTSVRRFFQGTGWDLAAGLATGLVAALILFRTGLVWGWFPAPLEWAAGLTVIAAGAWVAWSFVRVAGPQRFRSIRWNA